MAHPPQSGDQEALDAAGLAYVCENLEGLREDLAAGGGGGVLDRLLEACAAVPGPSLHGLLEEVHVALQRAGDPAGLWGADLGPLLADGGRGPLLAGGDRVPFEPVYLCPIGECDGREVVVGPGPVMCAITGRPLHREDL